MKLRFLVDTHILLWLFLDSQKISADIMSVLEDDTVTKLYSPLSVWEIAIKFGLGKLDLKGHTPDEFFKEVEDSGLSCLPLNNADLASSYQLPRHHGDPFDRMLYWQALRNDLCVLTADAPSYKYEAEGLRVIH